MTRSHYETDEQRQARAEAEALEELRQAALVKDLAQLLEMPQFQRVMSEIIGMGQLFQSIMTGNSHTFYNAGKADYAKQILAFVARADQKKAMNLLQIQKKEQ